MKNNLEITTLSKVKNKINFSPSNKNCEIKLRSTNFTSYGNTSKSPSKINTSNLIEITNSQSNQSTKKSENKFYENLHNEVKELKEKLIIKQKEKKENLIKESTTKIDQVSQEIERKQELFPHRFYPYHKLNKVDTDEDFLFEYDHVDSVESNLIGISKEFYNEDFKNNVDSMFSDKEEIKNLIGNKPSCVINDNDTGNKSSKQEKFIFHPSLNKNTCKISENLGSSNESIFRKCFTSSIDENVNKNTRLKKINFLEKNIFKSNEKIKKTILNYFENPKLKENNDYEIEKKKSYSINYNLLNKYNADKLNKKSIKIYNDIYTKGINMLKKKEKFIEEKKKSETLEINKLSFSPNINIIKEKNSIENSKLIIYNRNNSSNNFSNNKNKNKKKSTNNLYRSTSTNFNSPNNFPSQVIKIRKSNFSSEEYKTFHQSSYDTSLINSVHITLARKSINTINEKKKNSDINTCFYDKSKKWKENKESKNSILIEKKRKEEFIKYSFSPSIIKKHLNIFEEILEKNSTENLYITRRFSNIEKQEKNKINQNKIFVENSKDGIIKITKPQEFNFNQLSSRKCKDYSNKAKILHKAESVKNCRFKLNTNFFFKQAVYEIEENIESK